MSHSRKSNTVISTLSRVKLKSSVYESQEGGISTVLILKLSNKPTNAIDKDMLNQLSECLELAKKEIASNGGRGSLILSGGKGKWFCNGFDLEAMKAEKVSMSEMTSSLQRLVADLLVFPAPVVACLNGHTYGAGLILALSCDFRVMRYDRGWLCLPAVQLSILLPSPLILLISHKLGTAVASKLFLHGSRYSGKEALDKGLVDKALSLEDIHRVSQDVALEMCSKMGDPLVFSQTKTILVKRLHSDLMALRSKI